VTYAQLTGNHDKAKAIQHIKRVETLKRMYAKIRALKHRKNHGQFNHLIVSNPQSEQVITNPDEMVHHLIIRNQQHFGQAQGTPFSVPPLQAYTRLDHLTECDLLLPEAVTAIIEYIKSLPPSSPINTTITAKDLTSIYQCWNEATTTSPSGLHLGHDKCPIYYDKESPTSGLSKRLFQLKSQFINVALTANIVYPRWQQINTIMIEKSPGNFNINKLRALHIFESDLNAIFGILWGRCLMYKAEKDKILNDAQHGSRQGRSTNTLLLTKHMTYSLWRLTQTNGMSFDNDAKACYDRIVINLALLISQLLGMPLAVCEWYAQVLKMAQYHIQLPTITSNQYYQH